MKNTTKLKMSNKKFRIIMIATMTILLALIIAATTIMNYYSIVMNSAFGGPNVVIENLGSGGANADYYGKGNSSQEQSIIDAELLAEIVEKEGMVLLKNDNNALPLVASEKNPLEVNAFGWSFYYPVNGGAGAGAIGNDDLVSPEEAFLEAGLEINQGLKKEYIDWTEDNFSIWGAKAAERPAVSIGMMAHWDIPELDGATLDSAVKSSKASDNNVNIVWIGRTGGECADAPRQMDEHGNVKLFPNADKHYLELTDEEEAVIEAAKAMSGEDGKVIVMINAPSPLELAELQDDPDIDSIMWVGAPGKQGYHAIGKMLVGTYAPSGRLPDTYAVDFLNNPTIENFSDPEIYTVNTKNEKVNSQYDTSIEYGNDKTRDIFFLGYEEGIYNGYRWYETASKEGYFTATEGNDDAYYNRNDGVVYPFGYGLSYTTFNQEITSKSYSDGTFTVEVKVTNTGDVTAKDVVQLYVETPYIDGGVEKAQVVLTAFAKTKDLAKGQSETVTLVVDAEDFASYDDEIEKGYILDKGVYNFYIGTVDGVNYGSHSWAYANEKSTATFDDAITKKIVYNSSNPRDSETYAKDDEGKYGIAATNVFEENMAENNMSTKNGSETMSRTDFAGSYPTAPTAADGIMSPELKAILEGNLFDNKALVEMHNDIEDIMPLTNQDYGIQLIDLRGLDYEDPAWTKFIEQFTVAEMREMSGKAGWATLAVERLGKPMTNDNDGPQSLKYKALGTEALAVYLTAFPCEVVLAATWNTDLVYEVGKAIGEQGLQYGVNGWYAPGLNLHRSPFSGRNFEYFSEDPVLSGKLCAAEVSGAASKGLYAYVKHFAVNDQESYARNLNAGKSVELGMVGGALSINSNDCILLTWASEQSMRELYLKAFEIVFKEAKTDIEYIDENGETQIKKDFGAATAVMTSFNCIGDTWAGGNEALITDILRNEWGFEGLVLTDSIRTTYMYADQMLRAGGDACLMSYEIPIYDTESATSVKALQSSAKNICYTVVHSSAMNDISRDSLISYTLAPWQVGLVVGGVVIALLIAGGIVLIILRTKDEKKNPKNYTNKATK